MTILRMGLLLAGMLIGSVSTLAQVGAKLADICDDCRVEKYASCGAGKFLEGPNFDKAGVMWLVGLQSGEILKVSPAGECTVATKGVSFPGGTRFDKEGRLIVTSRTGLLSYDTASGVITTLRSYYGSQVFRGLNDVIVDKAGGIYFTEPNGSNLYRPNGRVFYLPPSRQGELTLIGDTFAFPNGLVLSPDESLLYVGEYSLNRTAAIPLERPGVLSIARTPYVFAYMKGGVGPDGMLVDARGNVYQAHYMAGEVVIHDPAGFEIGVIKIPPEAGRATTNITFHNGYLYITEASRNDIWRVKTKISPP